MTPPTPELNWVIRPDVVTSAIKALVWVVGGALSFLGASLIGTLLYIWTEHKKEMSKMTENVKSEIKGISSDLKSEIGRVAGSLETISSTLFDRQRAVEIRIGEQETRCEERHLNHRRATDL